MQDELDEVFKDLPRGHDGLEILVKCHDCKEKFGIRIAKVKGEYGYEGGSIYETPHGVKFKCDTCYEKNHDLELKKITYCEVFSRVVGYLRPINNWNDGKRAEFDKRIMVKPELNEIPRLQILPTMS